MRLLVLRGEPSYGIGTLIKGVSVEKKWQPTPAFLLGKFHEQRRLVGYSLWGHRVTRLRTYSHKSESESHSVMSDSLRPHKLYSPWNSPGQNTGVGSLSLLQGIFPTQGLNPGLQCCRRILYQPSHKGSPPTLPLWGRDPRKASSSLSAVRTERGVRLLGQAP